LACGVGGVLSNKNTRAGPTNSYPNLGSLLLARDHSSSNIDHHQTTTIDRQTITTTITIMAPSAQEELERTTQQEQEPEHTANNHNLLERLHVGDPSLTEISLDCDDQLHE
jgi:hypothetical protein